MGITYQQESLFDVVDDAEPLLHAHYAELTRDKARVKLSPMWERYATLESAGAFVIYTARNDGDLVGYAAFFIHEHMHYSDLMVAQNDVLFVRADQRGTTGLRLIRFAEQELQKRLASFKLTWHAKYTNNLQTILARLGYATEEVVMGKLF